jgi:opacity protein-like surface antigen
MKKYFYIVSAVVLLFTKAASGQDTTIQALVIHEKPTPVFHNGIAGIRYMPSVSKIKVRNSDGAVNGEFALSNGYGGFLGFNFTKNIGIQAEVIYNDLSQQYKDHELDRRIDISYINVPVLLSLNTNRIEAVNLNVVVGPQWGVNVGSKIETVGTTNATDAQAVLAVKKNDFGIAYGAGLDFCLNAAHSIRLDLGFRGVMGLMEVSDQSKTMDTNSYYIILEKSRVDTYAGYVGLTFLF